MTLAFTLLLLAGTPEQGDSFHAAANVLSQHCVRCHNEDKQRGGLDLSSHDALLVGGATDDAVHAGKPEESPLVQRAAEGSMPPEKDGRRLTDDEVAALAEWVRQGVPWPEGTTLPLLSVAPPVPWRSQAIAPRSQRRFFRWIGRRH